MRVEEKVRFRLGILICLDLGALLVFAAGCKQDSIDSVAPSLQPPASPGPPATPDPPEANSQSVSTNEDHLLI